MTEIHSSTEKELRAEKTAFGMWLYILSDCVLFAALFATYAVQHTAIFNGPSAEDLFSLPFVLVETLVLLTSSFTCGLAVLAAHKNKKVLTLSALAATFVLGLSFVAMELTEFRTLLQDSHSWHESSFLSSFFALVGTHGLHVTLGAIWMLALMLSIYLRGLNTSNLRKLTAFSLFWHFLDIIWIFIFTFVYMFGFL